MAAVAIRLVLVCLLMCTCVQALAGNHSNCTMNTHIEPRKGKRLPVSIIANVTAETVQLCVSICFRRSACRSVNYHMNASKFQCELNEFDRENDTNDDPNYVYSSISDWNQFMVYSCANHSCADDSICVPTLSQNYTCLQLDIRCHSPRSIEYTNEIEWPHERQYRSMVKYTCKPGYKYLSGDSRSICQLNMTWSKPSIKCSKVICGIPPNITNNDLNNYTGNDYGSTAYYKCGTGYNSTKEIGESKCSSNGTWTEPNINCTEINCGSPRNSSTAEVIFFNRTSVGAIAEYSCINDTILKSRRNISVCTSEGFWSKPVECGFCKDGNNVTYRERKVCYDRSELKRGYFSISPGNVLIASEKAVVSLFQQDAIHFQDDVFAGFEVNGTHVRFLNGTNISSLTFFDLGECLDGICIYNASGILTNLPSLKSEAYSYSIVDPN